MQSSVLVFISLSFILFSCSSPKVKWKEGWGDNKRMSTKKIEKKMDDLLEEKPQDNWARKYYKRTDFIVNNPKLVESKEDLDLICKSEEKMALSIYQGQNIDPIPYKLTPVSFVTKDGFSKKVFITKGVCRELVLFKSKGVPKARQIRKSIKKIVLSYIYNEGTYLKTIEFKTPFKSVEFLVE